MKQAFRLSGARRRFAALAFLTCVASATAQAQTTSPTPDSLVLQITNTVSLPSFSPAPSPSPTPTPQARSTFAGDISGNGRFVVMESTGDIATERSASRNNVDGNVEIFLFDYAQRRIFQITNTKHALKDAAASPTDSNNIDVEVRNISPTLSHDGRFIVFSSNAYSDAAPGVSPRDFDGNSHKAALQADGNMEIFAYQIPAVAPADLSAGDEVTAVDLSAGTMSRVTSTPASRLPTPGTATASPFIADDNRTPAINDDASFIAFISTRNITNLGGSSNADANPEVFVFNRTSPSFVQVTVTSGLFVFNDNPSLSGSGSVIAFFSTADINSTEAAGNRGNGEIHVADFNGSAASNVRPVTATPRSTDGDPTIILSPGRRLSRNGQFVAFETLANIGSNGTVSGDLQNTLAAYVLNISSGTFTAVVQRPPTGQIADVLRFPTFTGDSATVVFASSLNLRATNGEVLAENSTDGLNPGTATARLTQIFAVAVPSGTTAPANYQKLTRLPTPFASVQPQPSDTLRRASFSIAATELGGGNADNSFEAFYLIVPAATSELTGTVSFFTGASERPVVAPSPSPTPPAVGGLAPGMLGIARSTLTLAPVSREVDENNADEATRRPPLPVELSGVTVSVSGAAAGLYFVSAGQINFVVPVGLVPSGANTSVPVVINNNGAVIRTSVNIHPASPDIFTSTNGAGGRAAVLNVTNACVAPPGEPFSVTTTRPVGNVCTATETEQAPTELLIVLTGVRNITNPANVTVRIGTTDIIGTGTADSPVRSTGPSRTAGFDQIIVRLPASLAGAGDVPVIVTITTPAGTFTSRPADTAPRITIN
ncbi:MAG TPA: hypothetical protein VFX96_00170 [Pyrinomonadaceae bacterium]|nr:hypothetical protein [Pyrinomonadaceae bacterium]